MMQIPTALAGFRLPNGMGIGNQWNVTVDWSGSANNGTDLDDQSLRPALWPGWRRYRWALTRFSVVKTGTAVGAMKVLLEQVLVGVKGDGGTPSRSLQGMQHRDTSESQSADDFQGDEYGLVMTYSAINNLCLPLPEHWNGRIRFVGENLTDWSLTYSSGSTVAQEGQPKAGVVVGVSPLTYGGRFVRADADVFPWGC